MRGRTNATNGGIFLNATTDTFEVASGNDIVAGDFVEYVYDTGVTPMDVTFKNKTYIIDEANHIYLCCINNYPTLVYIVDNEITIISNLAFTITSLAQINQNYYVITGGGTDKGIKLLKVTSSTLEIVYEITVPDSSSYKYYYPAYSLENNLFALYFLYSGSGRRSDDKIHYWYTSRIHIYKVDIETETFSRTDYLESTYDSTTPYSGIGYQFLASGNGYFYARNSAGGSSERYKVDITTGEIGESISFSSLGTIIKNINDKYLVMISTNYIRLVDVESNAIISTNTKFSYTASTFTRELNNTDILIQISDSNGGSYAICHIDLTLLNMIVSNSASTPYNASTIFDFGNNIYGGMVNNRGYYLIENRNHIPIVGELTNTVQQWQGSGNPMGVAKQSGTAGDTIEVYIPQVNS